MVPGVPSMYDYELHPQEVQVSLQSPRPQALISTLQFPIPEELRTLIYPQIYPYAGLLDALIIVGRTK